MTVLGRDASDFDDDPIDFTGLGFFTHKATEGVSVKHKKYGARLAAARAAGVPVLGAYHVLRTPNSANGTLAEQLAYWLAYLDGQTPWWRTWPGFLLQIDAERWAYDNVAPDTVKAFAALVASKKIGFPVTYASNGQYRSGLDGIVTPLWNADYTSIGAYPGDSWAPTRSSSTGAWKGGWSPYSGQTPLFLQWASSPHDLNAFRGSLEQLVAMTTGGDMSAHSDDILGRWSQGFPTLSDGTTELTPVTWRLRDEAWQQKVDAALADLKAAQQPTITLTADQVERVGQVLAAALPGAIAQALRSLTLKAE